MTAQRLKSLSLLAALFAAGYLLGALRAPGSAPSETVESLGNHRVFELRTYTAAEGKLNDLLARFRNDTRRIFDKHDMTSVGYWTPQDAPLSDHTLIYMLAHPSREAATANWESFNTDPEWLAVAEESRRNGRLIVDVKRVFIDPTDFSLIQ